MDLTAASLLQSLAGFQSRALGTRFGADDAHRSDRFSGLLAERLERFRLQSDVAPLSGPGKASPPAAGRNLALFDPESAYRMMTFINQREALYKAQYAALGEMGAGLARMQAAGKGLARIAPDTPDAGVHALLEDFLVRYNRWREDVGADVAAGGLLDAMQAAEVALYELEQSLKHRFFGAGEGIRGLADLGVRIDATTGRASLDGDRLRRVLDTNRGGAVSALREFGANFAESARLLNADNNFMPNQLGNLSRAIDYLARNHAALTREFGSGDAAHPAGRVAQALAAYERSHARA